MLSKNEIQIVIPAHFVITYLIQTKLHPHLKNKMRQLKFHEQKLLKKGRLSRMEIR